MFDAELIKVHNEESPGWSAVVTDKLKARFK